MDIKERAAELEFQMNVKLYPTAALGISWGNLSEEVKARYRKRADQILNLPVSEEGVCDKCQGSGKLNITGGAGTILGTVSCWYCYCTGELSKTLKQLIKEAQND